MTNFYFVNSPSPVVPGSDEIEFKALYAPPATSSFPYFPITDREVAAGVLPVNYIYQPGDVRRYGAIAGDDPTATSSVNTAAFQAALDSNGFVWLEPGTTYMVGTLEIWSDTILDLNGSTIKLLAGVDWNETSLRIDPYDRNGTIIDPSLPTRQNIQIRNGNLDGNIANNPNPVIGTWTRPNDRGVSGIDICGNSSNIIISNMTFTGYFTDGMTIHPSQGQFTTTTDAFPKFIKVSNCTFDGNGRQGTSITCGHDISFDSCVFKNTYNAALPLGPHAGVDIEPIWGAFVTDYPDPLTVYTIYNIHFSKCEFKDNNGYGLIASFTPNKLVGLTVTDCTFSGNTPTLAETLQYELSFNAQGDAVEGIAGELDGVVVSNSQIGKGITIQGSATEPPYINISVTNCTGSKVVINKTGPGSKISLINCQLDRDTSNAATGTIATDDCDDTVLQVTGGRINATGLNRSFRLNGSLTTDLIINGAYIRSETNGVQLQGSGIKARIGGGTIIEATTTGALCNTLGSLVTADATFLNCTTGVSRSASSTLQVLSSKFEGCTTDTSGVNVLSNLSGPLADPNGTVAAGKGSTYQSTNDGSMWRNTSASDGGTTWTVVA